MRTRFVVLSAGLVAAAALAAGSAWSQDAGGGAAAPPKKGEFRGADPRDQDPAEMGRRMQEAMTPNKFHENLARFLGEWDTETKMWMMPGSDPMVAKGKATYSWLFQGKWIQGDTEGTMMGMAMKGKSLLGYDNFKKKYVGCWVDSLGTAMYSFEGNHGKDRTTLYLYGDMDEYMTGEHDKVAAYVYRFDGPDKFAMEIHDLSIGIEKSRVMEITFTRRK